MLFQTRVSANTMLDQDAIQGPACCALAYARQGTLYHRDSSLPQSRQGDTVLPAPFVQLWLCRAQVELGSRLSSLSFTDVQPQAHGGMPAGASWVAGWAPA